MRSLTLNPTSHRIEEFSDAVFAIVVTIMVFDIRIPESLVIGTDHTALGNFVVTLLTYGVSFVVVAVLWGNHHYLTFTLPNADPTTIWLNNHILFWVTLIPIVARFFGMHPTSPRAATAYALVVMMCTASLTLLRMHASRISRNESHRAIHRRIFRKAWVALIIWMAAIPLSFINIRLAWILFVVVPAMFFLPVTRELPETRTSGDMEQMQKELGPICL